MNPHQLRRLKAMIPPEGVFIDAARAKRLFDATPAELSDAERIAHVKGVQRMIAGERGASDPPWIHPVHGVEA